MALSGYTGTGLDQARWTSRSRSEDGARGRGLDKLDNAGLPYRVRSTLALPDRTCGLGAVLYRLFDEVSRFLVASQMKPSGSG